MNRLLYAARAIFTPLVVLIALLVPIAPAAAGAPCNDDGCEGQSAAATGCSAGAYAVAGVQVPSQDGTGTGELDLYYSPNCQAVWGEYDKMTNHDVGGSLSLSVQPEYGGVATEKWNQSVEDVDNDYPSTMVGWRNSVELCMTPGTCTGWR